MKTYTTISGDTWDIIAKAAYGSEMMADRLMKESRNLPLLDYQIFPPQVTVYIPDISEEEAYEADLPDWRKD